MKALVTRDSFRLAVFERDGYACVICGRTAQDAHHIMERRLFEDGGYYIDNGVSLCAECHIKAEQTLISPEEIRKAAHIERVLLPDHLYPDYTYTKWGDIENSNGTRYKGELFFDPSVQKILESGGALKRYLKYFKYPRTYHLPFSAGKTDDDKSLKDCSQFEGQEVILTTKMDGENTTGYWDGYTHARSLDSDNHPSRHWVKNFLSAKLYDLPEGWRICGENLYSKHSIYYRNLQTYFMVFSIWNERNVCLSHDVTKEWCDLLDLKMVPIWYRGIWDERLATGIGKEINGMANNETEGFVVRLVESFDYFNFKKSIAKFVRTNHVQTNQHWMKSAIVKNELCI